MGTPLTFSVVVPVFDEEDTIGDCLTRLAAQFDQITEIVVVDNNSTDGGRAVIDAWCSADPRVRVIDEVRQGLVYARNTGLDAATGDLIARIDADTRVPPDWARTIVEFFTADVRGDWAALCGRGEAYDVPLAGRLDRWKTRLHPLNRLRGEQSVSEVPVLYGSNMVLRRATWVRIRDRVSMRRNIFEDVDMGLCVGDAGGRNAFLRSLTVGVSPRRMETGMVPFVRYMSFLPRTFLLHRRFGLAAGSAAVYVPAITVAHALRLVVLRSYDSRTGRVDPRNLLRGGGSDRVLP
ncbi:MULTISPECIES: glycosyltransferase family 2 protein [Gordonia]|uniref:glycosyltransferase family 2 protein n=1 Tax=Gordonia TaxID=2053 RepID=UPI00080E7C7E|nr:MULTISPECIES: glycosyltransferase family 2 protein [Gordonia]MCT1354172.1 glycosyltransferase [Gordonia sp. p3-SID1431]OCH78849.1 glycosyl transferase [Gordonia sp. UCD-TK1]OCW88060.1 glycosyl transferase [Nocardia farcinica]UPG69932.1 glycosyltransferase [Gordonia hongkongensis]